MILKFRNKEWLTFILVIIIFINISIIFNIPYLRQILGLFFLVIFPGFLILRVLKLDKIGFIEKIILSIGLSTAFIMLCGVVINNFLLAIDYTAPLSVVPILLFFNAILIIIAIIGYLQNKETIFITPNLSLTRSEKVFLIVPFLFPTFSILGTYFMRSYENNSLLIFLLFLIPIYIVFMCFFNNKISKRLYPVILFLISISLLLIFMLRFPHIYGHDIHIEYGMFYQTTLQNQYWSVFGQSTLDSCLSISLLPTVYNSVLNINSQEFLFKGIYVLICSVGPIVLYLTAKKYVDELYAFLASFLFISQLAFLNTAGNPRTNVALLFVALAVFVLFNNKISPIKKQLIFVIFFLALIVSHYSTTYIFLFILIMTWIILEILSKKFEFNKFIGLSIILLFAVIMFFWYSQITGTAFDASLDFFKNSIGSMKNFFVEEARTSELGKLSGQGLADPVLSKINLAVTWSIFIFIALGVSVTLKKYKSMVSIFNFKNKKPSFLKTKFEPENITMAWICSGLLAAMVLIPFFSIGYDIQRLYSMSLIFLCVYFVIGAIILSKYLKLKPYFIILIVLLPYFLFLTGSIYQLSGHNTSTILNSEGIEYEQEYLHDHESYAAKWLKNQIEPDVVIYTTDYHSARKLTSQGNFKIQNVLHRSFYKYKPIESTLYLSYNNVQNKQFSVDYKLYDLMNYSSLYFEKNKIYSNPGSEVYQ